MPGDEAQDETTAVESSELKESVSGESGDENVSPEGTDGGKPMSKARRRMEEINRNKAKLKQAGGKSSAPSAPKTAPESSTESCSSGDRGSGSVSTKGTPDAWEHDRQPPIIGPVAIQYCPYCGLPPDFCEFGENWESQCKPWVMQHCPEYYPHLTSCSAVPSSSAARTSASPGATSTSDSSQPSSADRTGDSGVDPLSKGMSDLTVSGATASSTNSCGGAKLTESGAAPTDADVAPKKKSGGKKGVKTSGVTIQRVSRAKKKTVTVVIGLDTLGVKLDKASKLFSKRFSCGASVVKGGSGLPDQIDIQGDVEDALAEVITSNFPEVSTEHITYLRSK